METNSVLGTLFDNLPIGNAFVNSNFDLLEINAELLDYINSISKNKIFKKSDKINIGIENNLLLSALNFQVRQVFEKEQPIKDIEINLISKKKCNQYFSISVTPLPFNKNYCIIIVSDISYKKEIENELKKSNNELRKVSDYIEYAQEEERKKIAYWLHDDIGQALTGMKMDIAEIEQNMNNSVSSELKKRFLELSTTIDNTINKVREISTILRPPVLDHFGICQALEFQIKEMGKKSNFKVIFIKNIDDITLKDEKKTTLFRVMMELFVNIVRHSQATEVTLNLEKHENKLHINLYDNGIGFTKNTLISPMSFGLLAIQERVRSLNGKVNFILNESQGTEVRLIVPIK